MPNMSYLLPRSLFWGGILGGSGTGILALSRAMKRQREDSEGLGQYTIIPTYE